MISGRLMADITVTRHRLPEPFPVGLTVTRLPDGTFAVPAVKLARQLDPGLPLAEQTFASMYHGTFGADAEATCKARLQSVHGHRPHAAPDLRCTCGFYALSHGVDDRPGFALLDVALTGRILVFEQLGHRRDTTLLYRAEHQQVLAVHAALPAPTLGAIDPYLFGRLRRRIDYADAVKQRSSRVDGVVVFRGTDRIDPPPQPVGPPIPPYPGRRPRPDDPPLAARRRVPPDLMPPAATAVAMAGQRR